MALEMIERFLAVVTLVEGFAGGTAEFADEAGMGRMTSRTFDFPVSGVISPGRGGGNAVFFQFLFSFFRHPVGGPWR